MSLTITVISGLYQKIDPKVREARRKKFFGSGRRKRETEEDEDNLEEDEDNLEEDFVVAVKDSGLVKTTKSSLIPSFGTKNYIVWNLGLLHTIPYLVHE